VGGRAVIACDFCGDRADKNDGVIFVESPSKTCHICENCVGVCAGVIAATKEGNTK